MRSYDQCAHAIRTGFGRGNPRPPPSKYFTLMFAKIRPVNSCEIHGPCLKYGKLRRALATALKPSLTKGLAFESTTHTGCFLLGEALHQSAHFRFGELSSQSATNQSSKRIPFTPLHLEMNQSGLQHNLNTRFQFGTSHTHLCDRTCMFGVQSSNGGLDSNMLCSDCVSHLYSHHIV